MKITMIGTGYVGLVSGACFADLGNDVTCLDIDEEKINKLRGGIVPIYEPGLTDMVKRNAAEGRLQFTSKYEDAIIGREAVFICVGTPSGEHGKADLQYIFKAAEKIAEYLNDYCVIVQKSTVPVGTGKRIESLIKTKTQSEFDIVSNPEFLKEGAAIKDFQNPDRIIIGTESERAKKVMEALYKPHTRVDRPLVYMKRETAELVKYASNAMLACRISFMNSLAPLCERLGADIKDVAKGMGLDTRIGSRFLQASPGYGGSCFPKDVRALIDSMESNQVNAQLFRAVDQVNEFHKKSHLQRVKQFVPNLENKKIAIWGLAFKPRTDDIREASALTLIDQLLEEGATVCAYDPEAAENTKLRFPQIEYANNPYEAVSGAAAVVVMTEWDVFRGIDLKKIRDLLSEKNIIDCRNIYEPSEITELGMNYAGVGRQPKRVL
ncbi:MAG: UDP-glucose dehydrogenase family protein [Patescibacteria group bacterium]